MARQAAGTITGQKLGRYRIVEKIGAGGMGDVYRAHDEHLDREVAIKVLPPETIADSHSLQRFHNEAMALSRLNHPNICSIYDVDQQAGQPFIVMELLEGQTLTERIAGRPLRLDELLDLAIQIADALETAHAKGIVHRDIKPGNIFVLSRGQAKVLDFGLAKLTLPSTGDIRRPDWRNFDHARGRGGHHAISSAGAGTGQGSGRTRRPVQFWSGALRDDNRAAGILRKHLGDCL